MILATILFFIVKINESLGSNPNNTFSVQFLRSNIEYGMPPDAKQTATTFLQTNDARPLSGFIENNIIHFVGNTVDEDAKAAIYHSRLDLNNLGQGIHLTILNDTVLEFGYPNISFSGQGALDEQAVISFNHTSIDSFPGMSAIFYQKDVGYTDRLHVKSGNSKVNVLSGNYERWGDYSGSQRSYVDKGKVWVNGFIGFYNNLAALNKNQHRTYISSLWSADTTYVPTAIVDLPITAQKIYPNPTDSYVYIEFEADKNMELVFYLYDYQGKLVDKLANKMAKTGNNVFFFNTSSLAVGTYFVEAKQANSLPLFQEKVIIK
ncbi:MAG: T9SS type A sorting domain-containing protein [Chitinophagales bacterium]|nr:T9SS type A sorting domain-containing protein [Chitinophagales bacterium]